MWGVQKYSIEHFRTEMVDFQDNHAHCSESIETVPADSQSDHLHYCYVSL